MSSRATIYDQVAKKVISDSLHLVKGATLTIETWNTGLPLAKRLVVEARRAGIIPILLLEDESAYVESVRVMPKDVIGTMGRQEYNLLAGSDAYVFIPGPPISTYAPMLTRQEVTDSTRYNSSWYEAAEKAKLKGVRLPFGYIGKEYARLFGKSPDEMAQNQLRASLVDLRAVGETGREIAQEMKDAMTAVIQTGKEKLEFTMRGEVIVEDGVVDENDVQEGNNMVYLPPGFVSKQVDLSSVEGSVKLSATVTRLGLLKDAVLEFRAGKLVNWRSTGSPKTLVGLIEGVPPEKRVLSAVTVGINKAMKYGNGQDRMVAGALGISGFGFAGVIRNGTLSFGERVLVNKGRLSSLS